MEKGLLTMNQVEIERVSLIKQLSEKRLKQGEAGKLLKVSTRQIRRMLHAYRKEGASGLISKHRGRVSNNAHPNKLKHQIRTLIHSQYSDFGPTLAAEKLLERDQLKVSKESLRQWMIEWGLWKAKRQKKARVHQSRDRRACFGELIQLDGSHHDWFEGRSDKCCLLVLIDDATGRLVGLRFESQETTSGYFQVVREYIEREGRPLAFYSDKASIFRINRKENSQGKQTQFERAMKQLGIELICANSPQAKGRVERANGTLQDRLVKEMRLRGLNTQEEGNAFLNKFMEDHNRRFAVPPRSEINMHCKERPTSEELDLIFSFQSVRTLSKNLELSYENSVYQIKVEGPGYGLRHAKVTVCENLSGDVQLLYKGRKLAYRQHKKERQTAEIVNSKTLTSKIDQLVKQSTAYTPPKGHPWRKPFINPAKVKILNEAYPQGSQGA